jgi:hypothetical protein
MCGKRLTDASELFCYKCTLDDGDVYYVTAVSMQDAISHEEEIMGVKLCEYIGKGAIADV